MTKNNFIILTSSSILIILLIIYKLVILNNGETYFKKAESSFMSATESDVIDNRELENAILDYEKAIDKGIIKREAFDNLAKSYDLRNGDNENAERIYTKGIKIYPKDAEFYFYRANCREELGKFKLAFLDFEKCIKLAQAKKADFIPQAIYGRGAMRYMLGDFVNAEKDWKVAQSKTEYKIRTYQDYSQLFK